jgi:SAM-dependent methyltransferase
MEVPMHLSDLATRQIPPQPWAEGDNIPWHEPAFSARMLAEHLSQAHDAASRRASTIERQVAWLHESVRGSQPGTILDLGCGPGLYTSRLARHGHTCVGIDYSPASIAHARAEAAAQRLACIYHHADLRAADYGTGYDLVTLIFGELNVFSRTDAARILTKAYNALRPGGQLVLEPHTLATVQQMGAHPSAWSATERGLFSDLPHLLLLEHFWDTTVNVATIRYFVVTLADGAVTRYAQSIQGYTDAEYRDLLREQGFTESIFQPALTGEDRGEQSDFFAIVARK